jgi:hypothetical protein
MNYSKKEKPAKTKQGTLKKKQSSAVPQTHEGVYESSPYLPDRKVEQLLSDIVARLERIEEKIDENVYPPESAIKPEFIRQVKKAEADIRKGRGKTYESMDAFIRSISE